MLSLFRALTERVQALFVTTAALDFEAALLTRAAERQADLLRQADRYDAEGLHGIAQHLRAQAEQLSVQRPLAGVLPAMDHLLGHSARTTQSLLPALVPEEAPDVLPFAPPPLNAKKKGK